MSDSNQEQVAKASFSALDAGIEFTGTPETGLWCSYQPVLSAFEVLSSEHLQELASQAGFQAKIYPIDPESFLTLKRSMGNKISLEQLKLSEPRDAELTVFKSADGLLAGVEAKGPCGCGKTFDRLRINNILRANKVVRGILSDVVDYLLSAEFESDYRNNSRKFYSVIAYGKHPCHGRDGWIEPLVADFSDRRFDEHNASDEMGVVDFRECGAFPYVAEKEALLKIHPPTIPQNGETVSGNAIKANKGKPAKVKTDGSVKEVIDSDGSSTIVAVRSGLPVLPPRAVKVESVLKLEEVNLKTGHVRFDGSVFIKGDVKPEMKVECTGDVRVGGVVEHALIRSEGHVHVAGGVIGKQGAKNNDERSSIFARGSITVRFAHECALKAGESIIIGNQAHHALMQAGHQIKIQGKGQMIGGFALCGDRFEAGILGSRNFDKTQVTVAACQRQLDQVAKIKQTKEQLEVARYKIIEQARIKKRQGQIDKVRKLLKERLDDADQKKARLDALLEQAQRKLDEKRSIKIKATRHLYPGVTVSIADGTIDIAKEFRGLRELAWCELKGIAIN